MDMVATTHILNAPFTFMQTSFTHEKSIFKKLSTDTDSLSMNASQLLLTIVLYAGNLNCPDDLNAPSPFYIRPAQYDPWIKYPIGKALFIIVLALLIVLIYKRARMTYVLSFIVKRINVLWLGSSSEILQSFHLIEIYHEIKENGIKGMYRGIRKAHFWGLRSTYFQPIPLEETCGEKNYISWHIVMLLFWCVESFYDFFAMW